MRGSGANWRGLRPTLAALDPFQHEVDHSIVQFPSRYISPGLRGVNSTCISLRGSGPFTGMKMDQVMQSAALEITWFAGRAASDNTWIISNKSHIFPIDAPGSEEDAARLADDLSNNRKHSQTRNPADDH